MPVSGQPRRPSARGFTLTELVVVLVLTSVLAGVSVTSLNGLGSSRQNVAATRVRTAMVYAHEWAMDSGNDTWVAFDTTNDLVSVFVEDPGNPGKAGRLAMTDPLTHSPMTIQLGADGAGVDSADLGGTDEVHFDTLGIPRDSAGTILAADGTVGITGGITLRVTKNTGLVTVD
jgi:prepilin-type N-terminal cleavage/methylation domain-containing protein